MNARIPEPLEGIYLGAHKTLAAIRAQQRELTEIRRTLHANPEIGFEELFTSELVARRLAEYGVDEIHRAVGKTGVVGVIRGHGAKSGRSIGLRADMDALPMQEENEFAHRSANRCRKRVGLMARSICCSSQAKKVSPARKP
jgi:metal-dependent amidase/aminoacylase/carboxypeptidase family protein